MNKQKPHLQLSVFDRLHSEEDPGFIGNAGDDMDIVRNAVLRDVENLLNTRRRIIRPAESCKHLKASIYTYGVEDFATKNPRNPQVRHSIKTTIRETLSRFEPRLRNVAVAFNPREGKDQGLCFSVQATLHADPVSEPICFDTWFSASRGEYKIENVK